MSVERVRFAQSLIGLMGVRDGLEYRALAGGAAFWLIAVDESMSTQNLTIDNRTYKDRRDQSEDGRILRALKLARNEIAHGGALVVVAGAEFPIEFPVTFSTRFVQAEVIRRSYAERGRTPPAHDLFLYQELVEGREPADVLSRAAEWLEADLAGVSVQR